MKRLKELLEKRKALILELEKAGDEDRSEDFDKLAKDVEAIDVKITEARSQIDKLNAMRTVGKEMDDALDQPANEPVVENRSGKKPVVTSGEERCKFNSLAGQLQEIFFHGVNKRHKADGLYETLGKLPIEHRAALGISEMSDQEGDFLVQPDFAGTILDSMHEDPADVFNRPSWSFTQGKELLLNRLKSYDKSTSFTGAAISYWIGEGKDFTKSTMEFEQLGLKLHKVGALYYATSEAMEDIPGLTSDIEPMVGEELRQRISEAFYVGNGVKKPKGIISDSDIYVSVAKEDAQDAATVVFDNILNMYAAFNGNPATGVWMYNRQLFPQFPKLNAESGTSGNLVFMGPNGVAGMPLASIYGMPLIPSPHCLAPGTLGDFCLVDWSHYKALGKSSNAIQAVSSIHVQFLTEQTVFRFSTRVDGMPDLTSSITPKNRNGSDFKLSPIVVLAARA